MDKLNKKAEHRLKLHLEFYPVGENKRFIGRGERVGKLIEMGPGGGNLLGQLGGNIFGGCLDLCLRMKAPEDDD